MPVGNAGQRENHHTESQEKKHQLVSLKSLVPVTLSLPFVHCYFLSQCILFPSYYHSFPPLPPTSFHLFCIPTLEKNTHLLKIPHKTYYSYHKGFCRTREWYKRAGRRLIAKEWVLCKTVITTSAENILEKC